MTNTERFLLEIPGINMEYYGEFDIWLEEQGLNPQAEYVPTSTANKRAILHSALSILESIANNPTYMKNYRQEDMTITDFADNLHNRIDQLQRRIRLMTTDDTKDASYFILFNK
jgi:hypothetical protein